MDAQLVKHMKILITGGSGLLGSKIAEMAQSRGDEVFSGYAHNSPVFGRSVKFDLLDGPAISETIMRIKPEIIIHSAALTDVDRCERERELAYKINVEGMRIVSDASKRAGSFLIYISTDYIFDGIRGMYKEGDDPHPLNYYGLTKLRGEEFCDGCIARSCVIYGSRPASGKTNFALWVINSLRANHPINVVTDQFITPTLNSNLAEMVLEAGERQLEGIHHLAGASRISRYDFARTVARMLDLDLSLISPCRMEDMKWAAQRPRDSSLDTSKAARVLNEKPLSTEEAMQRLKDELAVL
jgi:dTDP-4-dehydrorhamnose reductase